MTWRDVRGIHMAGSMCYCMSDTLAAQLVERKLRNIQVWAWVSVLLSSLHLHPVPIYQEPIVVGSVLVIGANQHFVQVGQVLRGQIGRLLVVEGLSLPQSVGRTVLFVAFVLVVQEEYPLRSC